MITCRMTKTEYLQITYLDDIGHLKPEVMQVKIYPKELANIESFLGKGLKRIEKAFSRELEKDDYVDADVITEGQYCICLYHATQKAVITIKGATIALHFSAVLDLKTEINKIAESLKPNSAGLDKNHKVMSPKQMSDDYNLLLQPEETYNQAFLGVSDDGIPIYSFEALVDVASGLINNCDDHTECLKLVKDKLDSMGANKPIVLHFPM